MTDPSEIELAEKTLESCRESLSNAEAVLSGLIRDAIDRRLRTIGATYAAFNIGDNYCYRPDRKFIRVEEDEVYDREVSDLVDRHYDTLKHEIIVTWTPENGFYP